MTVPALPCLCASFRRAARALSNLYEEELRPLGIRGPQFTVLQVLSLAGELTQGQLGQMLVLDSTTLTRTLEVIRRQGWIERRRGTDQRQWRFRLSPAGQALFKRAQPRWEKAQARLRERLGANQWDELFKLVNHVTKAVTEEGDIV